VACRLSSPVDGCGKGHSAPCNAVLDAGSSVVYTVLSSDLVHAHEL
jgi:hypothetical protein